MLLSSLIFIPVVAALLVFATRNEKAAKTVSLLSSLVVLALALYLVRLKPGTVLLVLS